MKNEFYRQAVQHSCQWLRFWTISQLHQPLTVLIDWALTEVNSIPNCSLIAWSLLLIFPFMCKKSKKGKRPATMCQIYPNQHRRQWLSSSEDDYLQWAHLAIVHSMFSPSSDNYSEVPVVECRKLSRIIDKNQALATSKENSELWHCTPTLEAGCRGSSTNDAAKRRLL